VVSDAGVMLVVTLAQRLGVEALAQQLVRLRPGRPGAANAGRKVMAILYAMVLEADSIDDTGVLRAVRTRRLLGAWLPAPSTLGTFLVQQVNVVVGDRDDQLLAVANGAVARLGQRARKSSGLHIADTGVGCGVSNTSISGHRHCRVARSSCRMQAFPQLPKTKDANLQCRAAARGRRGLAQRYR
jgi:hypothetical protein